MKSTKSTWQEKLEINQCVVLAAVKHISFSFSFLNIKYPGTCQKTVALHF